MEAKWFLLSSKEKKAFNLIFYQNDSNQKPPAFIDYNNVKTILLIFNNSQNFTSGVDLRQICEVVINILLENKVKLFYLIIPHILKMEWMNFQCSILISLYMIEDKKWDDV